VAAKYIMGYISKVSGGGEKVQVWLCVPPPAAAHRFTSQPDRSPPPRPPDPPS